MSASQLLACTPLAGISNSLTVRDGSHVDDVKDQPCQPQVSGPWGQEAFDWSWVMSFASQPIPSLYHLYYQYTKQQESKDIPKVKIENELKEICTLKCFNYRYPNACTLFLDNLASFSVSIPSAERGFFHSGYLEHQIIMETLEANDTKLIQLIKYI